MKGSKDKRSQDHHSLQKIKSDVRFTVATACGLLLMGCHGQSGKNLRTREVPNTSHVVWLVCEDQSLFMPMYGDSNAHMPNVRSLAEEGTVFDHFFAVSPVCSPSRSSILIGVQPSAIGTHHMRAYQAAQPKFNTHTGLPIYSAPAPDGVRAFTEHLRMQGVYCTNNAKEDYNFATPPLAWDVSSKEAHWRNRPEGANFFSVFNFNVSHESSVWKRASIPCDVSPDDLIVPPLLPEHKDVRRDMATNYCNLEELDKRVGEVLAQLKEDGLYDQTTVVFYSDHGGPFPRFKRALSDAGLRVPMIVKWGQDVEAPARQSAMHSFLDLAPSVLAWMGVTPPETLPGLPITPMGDGHQEIHGASDRFDEEMDRVRTIRTRHWRLVRKDLPQKPKGLDLVYRQRMRTALAMDSLASNGIEPWHTWKHEARQPWELYHTSEDPWEMTDLSQEAIYADTLYNLQRKLALAFPAHLDLGRTSEAEMITSFERKIAEQDLQPATLVRNKEVLTLSHANPNVSLGWKPLGEDRWHITTSGLPIAPPAGTEVLELLAARIGWASQYTVEDIPD